MNDFKIVENLLPQGYADQIEQDLLRVKFPWYYVNDVTNPEYGNNSGLVHVAFDVGAEPSEWHPFIRPIVYSIEEAHGKKIDTVYRIRIGFLPKTDEPEYDCNTPHVDFLWPHYTACYYVNDSDGDTVLFDQRLSEVGDNLTIDAIDEYTAKTKFTVNARCTPKKNSVFIFNGNQFHASSKPKHHARRLVITVNYSIKE